ncbi:formate dehydrogenase accessory protein FdhE [Shewanella sp.]|uniref:formate dehydrogenase accessory protein FdhE n=1 Tax=Shewanella sp. TaxID=50422 RepID=UPI003A973379
MSNASDIPVMPIDPSPLALKPVLPAKPAALYRHRAKRLQTLAEDSPLADYLKLCSSLVGVQAKLAETDMGPAPELNAALEQPMSVANTHDNRYWLAQLQTLLSEALPLVPANVAEVIRELMQQSPDQWAEWGNSLRQGKFSEVPAQYSLFIWAAMSLYWSHWAPALISRMDVSALKQESLCPVCGSHPVASVVREEPREGLRYLHCSLCETEWHYVRAHCTACNQSEAMELWSFDDHQAAVRIETCDDCNGYTKMLFVTKSPQIDAVADDLASLGLDAQLSEQGYSATTVNPLLLAHEAD